MVLELRVLTPGIPAEAKALTTDKLPTQCYQKQN